ncbi:unnamed protein product [Cylicocyclus nassatus]|uniref:BZIP domain-containing protein n=1 Tax=Cylicocyclus nassatus TaxID=53992 RepID=A0AA36GGB5_CYLNA|nr:unnamed protein product [Cylicocyclus nassatus]
MSVRHSLPTALGTLNILQDSQHVPWLACASSPSFESRGGGRGRPPPINSCHCCRCVFAARVLLSPLSECEGSIPLIRADCARDIDNPEAVVFYSPEYEESLLMKYLGESPAGESVDECSADFANYDPLVSDSCMMPSYGNIDPTHSPVSLNGAALFYDELADGTVTPKLEEYEEKEEKPLHNSVRYDPIQKQSRRGRPMKVTSTSKMANYARNYREQKKMQLATYEAQVKQLTEENEHLRAENKRLTEGFERLSRQKILWRIIGPVWVSTPSVLPEWSGIALLRLSGSLA